MSRIFSSCFFAINKNWHIVICTLVFVCFHALCARFLTPAYGLKGLVGATALSSVFYFFALTACLLYLIGRLDFKTTAVMLLKNLPGLILLALCLIAYPYLFNALSLFLSLSLTLFASLSFVLLSGGGLYILSGLLLKEEMAFEFLSLFQKLFAKTKKSQ